MDVLLFSVSNQIIPVYYGFPCSFTHLVFLVSLERVYERMAEKQKTDCFVQRCTDNT